MHLTGNRPGETVVHKSNVPVGEKGSNEAAHGDQDLMTTYENFKKCCKIFVFGNFWFSSLGACLIFKSLYVSNSKHEEFRFRKGVGVSWVTRIRRSIFLAHIRIQPRSPKKGHPVQPSTAIVASHSPFTSPRSCRLGCVRHELRENVEPVHPPRRRVPIAAHRVLTTLGDFPPPASHVLHAAIHLSTCSFSWRSLFCVESSTSLKQPSSDIRALICITQPFA